jgi:phenylacetic acid degradation operon negative regulatory protein
MPTTPPVEAGAPAGQVEALVDRLHDNPPLRVWSLIVTIFGDVVAPRGGEVWAGTLSDLLGLMRIDAPAVRAALSRLARDGWLDRVKVGRLSYCALSEEGRRAFGPALARVYRLAPAEGTDETPPDLRVVILPEGDARAALRETALKAGYGLLAPGVLLGTPESPALADPSGPASGGIVTLAASVIGGSQAELVGRAFDLAPLADRYHAFVAAHATLDAALAAGHRPSPGEAIVARILLIHDYRRLILRDPLLPRALLPADWPGHAANALAARVYAALRPAAEAWIAEHARGLDGALPFAGADETRRFT